jgi:hypothetical protein
MGILKLDNDNTTYYVELNSTVNSSNLNQSITYLWELIDDGTMGTLLPDTSTLNSETFIVRGIDLFDTETHKFTVRLSVVQDNGCDATRTLTIDVTDEINEIKNIITTTGTTTTTTCEEGSLLVDGECVTIEDFIEDIVLVFEKETTLVNVTNKNIANTLFDEGTGGDYFNDNNQKLRRWAPYRVVSGTIVELTSEQAELVRRKIHIDKYVPSWYKNTNFTVGEKDVSGSGPKCWSELCSYWNPNDKRVVNLNLNIVTGESGNRTLQGEYTNYSVIFLKKIAEANPCGTSYSTAGSTGCGVWGVHDVVQFRGDGPNVSKQIEQYRVLGSKPIENQFIYKGSDGPKFFSDITDKTIIGFKTPGPGVKTSVDSPFKLYEVFAYDDAPDVNGFKKGLTLITKVGNDLISASGQPQ